MKYLLLTCALLLGSHMYSQNIGINEDGSTPDASAILDIKSDDKGLLVPRLTTAQMNAVASPADGLLIYNTTSSSFWFRQGGNWSNLDADDEDWLKLSYSYDFLQPIGDGTRIGIGVDPTFAKVQIYEDTLRKSLMIENNSYLANTIALDVIGNSASGVQTTINASISDSSNTGTKTNFKGVINSTTPGGFAKGISNSVISSGDGGFKFGIENILSSTGVGGFNTGLLNTVTSESANVTGIDNSTSVKSSSTGIKNVVHLDTATGTHYGLSNSLTGLGSGGHQYGFYNIISSEGTGPIFGQYNLLNGNSSNTGYGIYSEIASTYLGSNYAMYSKNLNSNGYAGYFLGRIYIGTDETNGYTLPDQAGLPGQIITSNGSTCFWQGVPLQIELSDQDLDTRIQVEESPDEDIIRFDVAGNEEVSIESGTVSIDGNLAIGHQNATSPLHVQEDGMSEQQEILAVLQSEVSKRPLILFSENATSDLSDGMSIEYDGRLYTDSNKIVLNALGGYPRFDFYNTGNMDIRLGDLLLTNPYFDKQIIMADDSGELDRVLMRQIGTQDVYVGDIDDNGGDTYIRAAGANRISAMADGNVGIGIDSPTSSLHVLRQGVFNQQEILLTLQSPTSDRPTILFTETNSSTLTDGMSLEYNGVASNPSKKLVINGLLGTSLFEFNNSGNFAIREGDIYMINSASDKQIIMADDSGGYDRVLMRQTGTQDIYVGDVDDNNADTYIRAAGANRISAMADGNVGVGTDSPVSALHVTRNGTSGQQEIIATLESSTSNRPLLLFSENTTSTLADGMSIEYNGVGSGSANRLAVNLIGGSPHTEFSNGGDVTVLDGDIRMGSTGTNKNLRMSDTSGNYDRVVTRSNNDVYLGDVDNNNGQVIIRTSGTDRMTIDAAGNIGVNTLVMTGKFNVNGQAAKPGGGSWSVLSDRRLKDHILPFSDGLQKVLAIDPVRYHYNENSGYETNVEYVGVIAQELQSITPYMVSEFEMNGDKYLNVDNSAMIYMLINAIKEQQSLINELEERLKDVESESRNQVLSEE